jgi:hypothetical protein
MIINEGNLNERMFQHESDDLKRLIPQNEKDSDPPSVIVFWTDGRTNFAVKPQWESNYRVLEQKCCYMNILTPIIRNFPFLTPQTPINIKCLNGLTFQKSMDSFWKFGPCLIISQRSRNASEVGW